MTEIILVQPKAGIWEKLGLHPPDSLLAVAAIPFREGYNVRLIDQRVNEKWKKDI